MSRSNNAARSASVRGVVSSCCVLVAGRAVPRLESRSVASTARSLNNNSGLSSDAADHVDHPDVCGVFAEGRDTNEGPLDTPSLSLAAIRAHAAGAKCRIIKER